ncbi:MAG: histidinol phosphate phosphatase domain-containing protein [Euryarchaeota archaeon]|nr:histidinol phosphate phosphatase domain-containing protein [Euryarchaeota archaeon]
MYDLHTHTLLSDGELMPAELIRRATVAGYKTLGITDHVDASNISEIIRAVAKVRDSAEEYGVDLIPGVEVTHVPPTEIAALAKRARDEGAEIVIVHGETTVEPVAEGTNMAACSCDDVDILAHPGIITLKEAAEAKSRDIALEITSRGGHNRTNGHVLKIAQEAGCRIVVDSDAHGPGDIMTGNARIAVARGAGMSVEESARVLSQDIRQWLANRQ